VLSKLTRTPKQWISELLHAFNRGDLATFKTITAAQVLC
jgi:hypothetical protein